MGNLLGQHFLKNNAVIKKIITAIDPQPNETIFEVGPGHGELTVPLAEACEKVGAKIIAIEKDERLARELTSRIRNLATKQSSRAAKEIIPDDASVEIVNDDVLEFFKTVSHERFAQSGNSAPSVFKIVGNIPYYLTGHLLRILSELEAKPERVVLMIQKEVAERIAAEPPRMNRLAASVQFWAEPKIIASVPRADFTPPPEVDSAVIELQTKKMSGSGNDAADSKTSTALTAVSEQYYAVVRALFAQPRKTVLNNLSAGDQSESDTATKKTAAIKTLEKLGIDPKSRPQDLTIENIVAIAGQLSSVHK